LDEAELDKVLFQDLKIKKDGGVIISNNVQEVNFLPKINDEIQTVGRNAEIYKIIESLDDNKNNPFKIVHIFGPKDAGKSAIAKYAAKYCLNRKLFPQGIYYLDIYNKIHIHNFIDLIYDRLKLSRIGNFLNDYSLNSNALENLISTISFSRILIIIDNC